jgi:hypothetical protein
MNKMFQLTILKIYSIKKMIRLNNKLIQIKN